ncbi:condensation domain-containing protein [Nonomuraea jabiensis]|uniref:condensation domain-containing protein n=1 Tax=Nonomuraea jabiensis TaxID=882448 RepID=UPI003D765B14
MARAPYYADLSGSYCVPVPKGCGMGDVTNALAAVLGRYETFRSRYTITPEGAPQQLIVAAGHLLVDVRDVDAADAQQAAADAALEFNKLAFTLPELSLRATVIASAGVPRFVVLCTFHMAVDCHGVVAVLDDFQALLRGESLGSEPEGTIHPVDRALEENSAQGAQRSARGVRYWKQELEKFPADPLAFTGRRPESPRYRTYAMHSPALRVTVLELAEELGVSASSVILAAAASLLALRSGSPTCGIVLAASHRYDPASLQYPGTLVQGVPTALDVSGLSLRELIARCHRASMLAALAGHCHPEELAEMLRASFGQEATEARLACVVNLNLPSITAATEHEGKRTIRAEAERLLTESRYEYAGGTSVEKERFYLAAHGDSTNFFITLRADTAVLSSAEIVDFLRDLERSLLDCLPYSAVV